MARRRMRNEHCGALGLLSNWRLSATLCVCLFCGDACSLDASEETNTSTPSTAAASKPLGDFVHDELAAAWNAAGVAPSGDEREGKWARRLYLDLLGRIPSYAETQRYLSDKGPQRRERLVDLLLGPDYAEAFAEHAADVWTNLLVGRSSDNDRLVNREALWEYLHEAFLENRPFHYVVEELLTATGSVAPGGENFNGAANYLSGKLGDGAVQATDSVSRVFLGMQVQCTQCHNHPFNKSKQNQFWELNSFFRQARTLRRYAGGDEMGAVLIDQDFIAEDGDVDHAAVFIRNATSWRAPFIQSLLTRRSPARSRASLPAAVSRS